MEQILARLEQGNGSEQDLETLLDTATTSSAGRSAPWATARPADRVGHQVFRDEFVAHYESGVARSATPRRSCPALAGAH